MRVFLQTRGRTTDYEFLGQWPAKRWWLEFRSFTSFEKPTLLVTSDETDWKAYLSGILSARFDRVNTPIRYSLVLEGTAAEEDVGNATKLIAAWVADAASQAESKKVQVALDTALPEEIVEGLLGDHSSEAVKEIEQRLRTALSCLANPPCPSRLAKARREQNVAFAWVGGIQAKTCQVAFLGRVDTLLNGVEGAALMVNLVGNEEEASAILDKHPEAAVLLHDPAPSFESEDVVRLEKKKLTQVPKGGNEAISSRTSQIRNILLKTVIILGAITLLALGLHYSFKTDPGRIELSP